MATRGIKALAIRTRMLQPNATAKRTQLKFSWPTWTNSCWANAPATPVDSKTSLETSRETASLAVEPISINNQVIKGTKLAVNNLIAHPDRKMDKPRITN